MTTKLLGLLLVAGSGSLFAESHFSVMIGGAPGYNAPQQEAHDHYLRHDLREDYRDVQNDYAQVDRLRADIARDRYQLQVALEDGDEWQASRIARDLARDQRALDALLRDIARDHHDIHRDQQELYRNRGYWGYWGR
jgi:septal ring factor EnvC (AmiA/AmiB activator)